MTTITKSVLVEARHQMLSMMWARRITVDKRDHIRAFITSFSRLLWATWIVQMSGDLPKCYFKVTVSPAGVEVPAVTIKPGSIAKNRSESVTWSVFLPSRKCWSMEEWKFRFPPQEPALGFYRHTSLFHSKYGTCRRRREKDASDGAPASRDNAERQTEPPEPW